MLDYANIIAAGQQIVPNLRQQLMQDAVLDQQKLAYQAQQDALQRKLAEQEEAKRRQAEFQGELEGALTSNDPRALINLRLRYPEYSEGLKGGFDALDEANRRDVLTTLGTVFARGQSGDWQGAADAFRQRVEADRQSGNPDPQDEAILAALSGPSDVEKRAALNTIGIMLAAVEPDKFAESYGKLNSDEKMSPFMREYQDRVREFGKSAADAWRETEDAKILALNPGGSVYRFEGGVPSDSQSRGGDPSGSQVVGFDVYQGAANVLGPEGAAMMLQRRGQTVAVQTPAQAQSLPSGVRYRTPEGLEIVR